MKRSLLIHFAWGLTVLGAFVFGRQFSRPADAPPASGAGRTAILDLRAQSALPSGPLGKTGADKEGGANAGTAAASRALTPRQIEDTAKKAFTDPNPLTRTLAFAKLLESMTPDNVHQIMDSMRANRAQGDQWRLFSYAWGAMDGAGAIAHAETLEGDQKKAFLGQALTGWAGKDPNAAIAWVNSLSNQDEKNSLQGSIVSGLADKDTALAVSYVYELEKAGNRQAASHMQTVAAEELRRHGPEGAARWGESLPDGPLKGAALDSVANAYVRQDPEAAASWAAKFAGTDYGARAVEEVGREWAAKDPQAAVTWLQSLNEGPAQAWGARSAFSQWTQRDPLAASQYLASMPHSPFRDSAVSGLVRSIAGEDPESAMIWAQTIRDERSRMRNIMRTGREWFQRDPGAAAAWLETAGISQEAKQAIINPQRRDRPRSRG